MESGGGAAAALHSVFRGAGPHTTGAFEVDVY